MKGGSLWKRRASAVKGGRERPAADWAKKAEWAAGLIRKNRKVLIFEYK
jgi:hypothetical protein